MSKRFYTLGLSSLTLIAGLTLAAPASAQLGGVTGSVGGTVDSTIGTSTDISSRTRATVRTPQARAPKPRTKIKARVASPTVVTYGSTRSGGYHAHGHYANHTHTHGYDYYYDDHTHGHTHGHAHSSGGHVYMHGEIKSPKKVDETKDEKYTEAAVIYSKVDLLTYGTPVKTESGASMGVINSLQRVQGGEIVGVTVGETMNLIPVGELDVSGNVFIHTPSHKKTKGELAFEAQVEMVK